MNREEILKRLAEIKGLIEKETDPAKLAEYGEEARSLNKQLGVIEGEARANARSAFENSSEKHDVGHRDPLPEKLSRRQALSLATGLCARQKMPSEEQKRALGVALTTTATTYVAATSSVDGVNNAGVLIQTKLILDYLKEEGKLSPILNDIVFTNVRGLVVYPYRDSRTSAAAKAEGASTGKSQFKLAKLDLVKGWLQIVIDVTDEVASLTDIDLGSYILDNIVNDLTEDWASDLIYGAGSGDHVKGLTSGATTTGIGSYAVGKELEAIIAGIKLCKGKYRRGAKIYLAQDVYDAVAFTVDDNGNFKYPAINNTVGISAIGAIRVEIDENLHDGDFVIANVSKYYKANLLQGLSLESYRDINTHVTTYVGAQYIAAAPFPGSVVFGSKAS